MSGNPLVQLQQRSDSNESADSGDGLKGNRSPGAVSRSVSEDFGCGSELAEADLHQHHEVADFLDNDSDLGEGNLVNALRARGGRPTDVSAPFTALQFPLLQFGDQDLQTNTEATLNLLNNLLGSAIMVMPRAFANVGIVNGLILLVAMVMANRYTLLSVFRMSMTTLDQEPSYPEIGKRVMGRQGLLAVLVSYMLLTGGCLIGMTIALADCLHQLFGFDVPRILWVAAAVLLCTPGALLKTLRNIAVLSGVCMIGVVTVVALLTMVCLSDIFAPKQAEHVGVGMVLHEAATNNPAGVQERHWYFCIMEPQGIFVTLSLFAFQYSVQAGGIEVLTKIRPEESTSDGDDSHGTVPIGQVERITSVAFGLAAFMSGACGLAGYLRFGDEAMGNILLNFTSDDHHWTMMVVRIAYVFVITCSFAFIIVPCRYAVYDLFGLRRRNVPMDSAEAISAKTFRKTTGIILLACFLVATFVSDLAVMFNYVGVWATMAIGFILPCVFQIELRRRQEGSDYLDAKNMIPVSLILLGVGIIVGNSSLWILELFEPAVGTATSVSFLTSTLAPVVALPSTLAPVAPAGLITVAPPGLITSTLAPS